MFVRFFVHFLHELREETGIKGGSDNPGYYIPGHLLRKILDQDQVDNDVPLVNVCKAKVESRMICALDRLFYAALGLESFTKISHPTEQDKEKLRGTVLFCPGRQFLLVLLFLPEMRTLENRFLRNQTMQNRLSVEFYNNNYYFRSVLSLE
ncbi:hypothetical protein PFISCL1PPCAC_25775 [Pristionchus fissidentatus]|uniref:Uncharacterized protein n=1 Tax=Pristionchus fissidentatus TaxID=1538716 RepID=A0AAV5WUZ7_9BILA|nr:hypothetical protein PFISCL1PPCAC_25775 [Pristionchus fissidentatus]